MQNYDIKYKNFLEVPKREEKFIAKNIELEKGIARNRALLDNLFALFVTINTKVPIFIVGKPGCSKSLSVQLINKSMKGDSSSNYIFKNLPRIIMNSYQGSMGSTSKGVKSVFKRARAKLRNIREKEGENTKEQKIISMIYFDEMGLAEHSPNNPLKVIHAELEYDLNEGDKKIAFVGISNWALDASKMNRGLYLSIPDPDEEDVKKTSRTIGKSYNSDLAKHYRPLYENLGVIYYKYKDYLNKNLTNNLKEFHGNRDFYHLIKNVANNIVKENKIAIGEEKKNEFIIGGLERNFAGLTLENPTESSLSKIKRFYNNQARIQDKYDIIQRISENIEDLKSRYLLVISKPSLSEFLLTSILKKKNKEYNYYKGSPFEDDLKSEEYILKILNKVQLDMEQDKVLILNNLGTVYPGLYDLFNQNFTKTMGKNYARIALGYTTNAYSFVNDKFRCIVNVEQDKINNEEPPFLNRFEKHVLSFENLLTNDEIKESESIYNKLLELTKNEDKIFKAFNYNLQEIFINLDKEELKGYIYQLKENGIKSDDFTNKVLEKISLLLPQDIILFLKYCGFQAKSPEYSNKILDYYKKGEHTNLSKFLKQMNNMKNVVYTFSDIFTKIEKIDNFTNDMLGGTIKLDNISDIEIGLFTSENKFEEQLDEFFSEKDKKLCLIKFNYNERHFLNYVKFFIENKEKENKLNDKKDQNDKKAFVFIVKLDRYFDSSNLNNNLKIGEDEKEEMKKYNETISLTSDFYQIFIDDLNGSEDYSLNDFLNFNGKELFMKCINYEQRINQDIYETCTYMDYNIPFSYKDISKKNYVKKLINYIRENKEIKKKINDIIITQMAKDTNILSNVFKIKNLVTSYDKNITSSILRYFNQLYTNIWNNFYYKAERDQFFSSLLSLEKEEKKQFGINVIKGEDDDEEEKNKNEEKKKNVYQENIINSAKEKYLDNFKFEDEINEKNEKEEENKKNNNIFKVIEGIEANHIDIILGLGLPGIYPIISSTIEKTRNEVFKEYSNNESRLRKFIKDDEIQNEKIEYKQKLKILNNYILIDLNKNEKIKTIPKGELEKFEFADNFLEDYYTIFIYNNLSNYILNIKNNNPEFQTNLDDLKNMLKFLVEQRNKLFKINKDDLESVTSIINWIEFYSNEISYILKIYLRLNVFMNQINEKIEIEKYVNNNLPTSIKYEISERCKEYTSLVNEAIFFGFESLLKNITSKIKLYTDIKNDDFIKFIDMAKEILNQVTKFDIDHKLYSKELLSLQEILEIIDFLVINKKCTKNNIEKILNYFSKGINDNIELSQSFDEFCKNLEEILGKEDSYFKLISIIFKNEFIKNMNNKEFIQKITEIITSNNEYIYNNFKLFKIILNFDIAPSKMRENLNKILEDEKLLNIINTNCHKEFLEQSIFNIYDYLFMLYFTKTFTNLTDTKKAPMREDKEMFKELIETKNETKIVFELSFDIFKDCIIFLDKKSDKNEKNYNLAKLYSISYIKAYLNQLVNFSLEKFQNLGPINQIIDFINGNNNKFREVIRIYIIKLFFNSEKVKRNYKQLSDLKPPTLGYDFIPTMLMDEKSAERTKEIIEEKKSPTLEEYNEYPYLKYFIYSINKKKELEIFKKQIKNQKDYMNKYPIIYKFLKDNENGKELQILKHVEKYNKFCNFMIDTFSFKKTREEAKIEKLIDQKIIAEKMKLKNNMISEFLKCWKEINKKAIQYKSNKLDVKELKSDDNLIFFLNDINEIGYGMYMAAGYQYFINLQNDFLNFILEHGKDKPYLKFFFENMQNKIPIYKANNKQILLIYHIFKLSDYKMFSDLVNTFAKRKIYNKDGSINYLNYNELDFDFQSIEEEMAKLILTGKCLFEDEDHLNFVNYWGEGFNGGKSDFLERFEKKYEYKTEELTEDEKKNICQYINVSFNIKDPNDLKKIYGYIQMLIFYFINNNCNLEEGITKTIQDMEEYIKLNDNNVIGIFNANDNNLKVKKIISIFLFFEHLCFEVFKENLNDEYIEEIDNRIKDKIIDNLVNNENNKIYLKQLAASIRRFISRYLYRINNQEEFSPKGKLIIHLKKRIDLWDKDLRNSEKIEKILELIKEYDLNVGQGLKLYELIKEEDEKEINIFTEKRMKPGGRLQGEESSDDDDDVDDDDEDEKKNKKRKKGLGS